MAERGREREDVVDAKCFELEDQWGKVGTLDLGRCGGRKRREGGGGVQAETFAWGCATGASGALSCGGLRDWHCSEGGNICGRIVGPKFDEAAVDHVADVGDSDAGFGNIGSNDAFTCSLGGGREDVHLLIGAESGVQGQGLERVEGGGKGGRELGERLYSGLDLFAASEEDENVALGFLFVDLEGDVYGTLKVVFSRLREVEKIDRVGTSFDTEDATLLYV